MLVGRGKYPTNRGGVWNSYRFVEVPTGFLEAALVSVSGFLITGVRHRWRELVNLMIEVFFTVGIQPK